MEGNLIQQNDTLRLGEWDKSFGSRDINPDGRNLGKLWEFRQTS